MFLPGDEVRSPVYFKVEFGKVSLSERVRHFDAADVDDDDDVDADVDVSDDGADDGVNVAVFEDALPKASLEAAPLEAAPLELLMLMTASMLVMIPMTLLIFLGMLL